MAKGGARELNNRIKSVGNIRKITKAMEMVAAARMKKIIARTISARSHSQAAWEILTNIAESIRNGNPLLTARPVKRICIVLISSNKGLCGGLNTQLIKKVMEQVKSPYDLMINRTKDMKIEPEVDTKHVEIDFVVVGRKGAEALVREKQNVVASFLEWNENTQAGEISPLTDFLLESYISHKYDKVVVAFNNFVSVVKNDPKFRQLLPLSKRDIEKQLREAGETQRGRKKELEEIREEFKEADYLFEPSRRKVLDIILPRMIESQIYQAFLESQASEFSSRMLTMKNASEVARDIMDEFSLRYNVARQAGITSELAEISASMVEMEK